MDFTKFCEQLPCEQNAVDIFSGRWASKLPFHIEGLSAGETPLFDGDQRPVFAAHAFGDVFKRLDGFQVLELGPLEGGHTYQLERFGAQVTAIEGNAEAYLKCLVVKELYNLKSKFYLGDFIKYLETANKTYDLIFAAGVLYHMMEPVKLIELMCKRSPRCFIWTHYYDAEICSDFIECPVTCGDQSVLHYQKDYGDRSHGRFWGGLADAASWLRRQDIVDALKRFGHTNVEIVSEDTGHPNGPCLSLVSSV